MENIKRKNRIECMALSILMLCFMIGRTHAQSSANYTVEKSVFDEGGSLSRSTGYTVQDAAGQPSPLDACASANYSESSGIWVRVGSMPTAVGETNAENCPATFNLFQNYPNPFNPETEIRFALARHSRVVIDVFNTLGQQIVTLINKQYAAGFHSVHWDGNDRNGRRASSGIYVYRIQAGEFSQVKKMILLK